MEPRQVLAAITVTATADDLTPNDGSVSLREAITAINAGNNLGDPDIIAQNAGTFGSNDTIQFNIAGSGVQTINVGSDATAAGIALPAIIKPLAIDGYTQPGASVNTLANGDNAKILIELNGASAGANADGLLLGAGSNASLVEGLAINRFSANGIELKSGGNGIIGNFVGTNPAGTAAEANAVDGIRISNSSLNTIGNTTPDSRNLVSGNAVDGIHIVGTLALPATGNFVKGNFVGTSATGTGSVGNRPGAPAPGTPEGNALFGIEVSGGNSNIIGGATAGARNVVGLNADGIELDNGAQNNTVQGNFSGVGADGVTPVGNLLHGISIRSDGNLNAPLGPGQANEPATSNNQIGGTVAGGGNLVEFNGTAGVAVFGNPTSLSGQPNVGNAILGNSIFQNGRSNPSFLLGIDLSNSFPFPKDDGLTPNDSKGHGAANAPNNFQNFPVLTSAVPANGPGTTITGTLTQSVSPNTTFRIEFFANNADPAGGVAEGLTFLGSTSATTNANGNANFSVTVPGTTTAGQAVTATATDPNNNTSEFSAAAVVPFPAMNFVVTNTTDAGAGSLRAAITASNANTGVINTISFNIPGSGVNTINLLSALPAITQSVVIDGYSEPGASANTLANGDNAKLLIELNGAGAGANADGLVVNIAGGSVTTIRGLDINRFTGNGIHLLSGFNTITGNFVGTNPAGNVAEPNAIDGIQIQNSSNDTIGGTTPDTRNLVSGNALDGIHIVGTLALPATGNFVEGNFVGTSAAGTGSVGNRPSGASAGTAEGNGLFGIEVSGGNSNTIGGTTAGARNVVGLNVDGIELDNGAQNNTVQGNFSGVGADGVTPLGNVLHGISIRSDGNLNPPLGPGQANEPATSNNQIGGTAAGAGNLVEFNGNGGVAVFGNPPSLSGQPNVGNAILGNSIFENGRSNPSFQLGIDLSTSFPYPKDDGVTSNDANGHGAANDPNNFQNFPVLTSATPATGGGVTITGTLTQPVSSNTTFRIEFFANAADPAHGAVEGQTFLGFTNVSTVNGVSNFSFTSVAFSVTLAANVSGGQFVTATATDSLLGNTSEFSAAVEVPFPLPTVSGILPTGVPEGATANLTVSGTNYVSGSVVQLNGTPLATTFVSATQLQAVAPAALLTDEGQVSLVVVNPTPGGGASNAQLLGVLEASLPDGSHGTPNQRFVAEVYRDLLGRAVDSGGLAGWSAQLDVGVSRNAVVAGIEGTFEYRAHVVGTLYQTYLHRAADSQGLVNFVTFLAGGGTDEQAAAIIIASPEYLKVRGGGTTDGFLDALFQDTLVRAVEPQARIAFDHFLANGGTRQQAAAIIFGSDEYRRDLVAGFYQQYLDRPAENLGLSLFTGALAHGSTDEQVIAIIAASPEYFSKTAV